MPDTPYLNIPLIVPAEPNIQAYAAWCVERRIQIHDIRNEGLRSKGIIPQDDPFGPGLNSSSSNAFLTPFGCAMGLTPPPLPDLGLEHRS